jgi:hypothetical protein
MLSTRFVPVFARYAVVVACLNALFFSANPRSAFAQTPPSRTATPVISPPTGSYAGAQTVTITDSNSSATIYYTIDGTAPTTSSPTYAGPFPVSATSTVQAIAVASGSANSLFASAVYTLNNVAVNLNLAGGDPYTMTCTVLGSNQFSSSGPTGTVAFTDTATAQTLGAASLGTGSAVQQLQYLDVNLFPDYDSLPMASADFNGDGNLDLITGSSSGVDLSLGNGDGTFQAPTVIALPPALPPNGVSQVAGVATGDFNGDGKMDFAVVQYTGSYIDPPSNELVGSVAVYLGNGDGTFQAPVTYAAGEFPLGIVAADFGNGNLVS